MYLSCPPFFCVSVVFGPYNLNVCSFWGQVLLADVFVHAWGCLYILCLLPFCCRPYFLTLSLVAGYTFLTRVCLRRCFCRVRSKRCGATPRGSSGGESCLFAVSQFLVLPTIFALRPAFVRAFFPKIARDPTRIIRR